MGFNHGVTTPGTAELLLVSSNVEVGLVGWRVAIRTGDRVGSGSVRKVVFGVRMDGDRAPWHLRVLRNPRSSALSLLVFTQGGALESFSLDAADSLPTCHDGCQLANFFPSCEDGATKVSLVASPASPSVALVVGRRVVVWEHAVQTFSWTAPADVAVATVAWAHNLDGKGGHDGIEGGQEGARAPVAGSRLVVVTDDGLVRLVGSGGGRSYDRHLGSVGMTSQVLAAGLVKACAYDPLSRQEVVCDVVAVVTGAGCVYYFPVSDGVAMDDGPVQLGSGAALAAAVLVPRSHLPDSIALLTVGSDDGLVSLYAHPLEPASVDEPAGLVVPVASFVPVGATDATALPAVTASGDVALVTADRTVEVYQCLDQPRYAREAVLDPPPGADPRAPLCTTWFPTQDGFGVLAVVAGSEVCIYDQATGEGRNSGWSLLARASHLSNTSSLGAVFTGDGSLAVVCEAGLITVPATGFQPSAAGRRASDDRAQTLFELAMASHRILPYYHPRFLLRNTCAGRLGRVTTILNHVVAELRRNPPAPGRTQTLPVLSINAMFGDLDDGDGQLASVSAATADVVGGGSGAEVLDLFAPRSTASLLFGGGGNAVVSTSTTAATGASKYADLFAAPTLDGPSAGDAQASGSVGGAAASDSFSLDDARWLEETLMGARVAGLVGQDQIRLISVAVAFAELGAERQSLDDRGFMFMMAVRMHMFLRRVLPAARRPSGLRTADYALALHSLVQEALVEFCRPLLVSWGDFCALGLALWTDNLLLLRPALEDLARARFRVKRDPEDAALLYILLGKVNVLAGLYASNGNQYGRVGAPCVCLACGCLLCALVLRGFVWCVVVYCVLVLPGCVMW